jgi:hypothetical protein
VLLSDCRKAGLAIHLYSHYERTPLVVMVRPSHDLHQSRLGRFYLRSDIKGKTPLGG